MAGRGLIRRFLDRISKPSDESSRRVPPESPPPPPPQPPPQDIDPRNRYEQIWNEEVSRRTQRRISEDSGYSRREIIQFHIELFFSIPGMPDEEPRDAAEFWREYLQAFVSGTRDRIAYLREIGLHKEDFRWTEWRNAMGYRERR